MFILALSLLSLGLTKTLDDSTLLAPHGFTPAVARSQDVFLFDSRHFDTDTCGAEGTNVVHVSNDVATSDLLDTMFVFSIDGGVVECDSAADPPCLGHPNKDRPFLPTSVYYDPIRTHYAHLSVSVRHDVLQVNPGAEFDDPVFVATRAILSLSNPGHVTRHVDYEVLFRDTESFTIVETSSGDTAVDASDYWILGYPASSDRLYLFQLYSPCKDDSHHYEVKDTEIRSATCTSGSNQELAHSAKVMIHSGETVLVEVVAEVFATADINLARQRARRVSARHNEADTHWFGGLTNKERASIVNYCADDDDGENDDDDSSDSSDSSFSTSRLDDDVFVFHYVEDHCDDPLIKSKDRRYTGRFSEEITSSAIYSSSVDRYHDSSSSSSSSSHGYHHHHAEEHQEEEAVEHMQ